MSSIRAHTPDILTRTESLNALSRQAPLSITGLTGGGPTNLDGMDASDTPIGTHMSLTVGAYRYDYTMKASVAAENSPSVIVPDTGGDGKRWVLDLIPPAAGGEGATGSSIRDAIIQASHGFVAEDVIYHNGTIWTKARADTLASARPVAVVESITDVNSFVAVYQGDITLTGKTAGEYFLSATTAGRLTATAPTTSTHYKVFVLTAVSATVGVVSISEPLSLALIDLTNDTTGVLPATRGGAGTVTGIMVANGSGGVSAATAGSGISIAGNTVSATGSAGVSDVLFGDSWNGVDEVAPSKNALYDSFGSYLLRPVTIATGGTQALTTTPTLITLGAVPTSITLDRAGVWLLFARANAYLSAATYAASQTCTVKLRRTNNTPADVTDGAATVPVPVVTTGTWGLGLPPLPFVVYTTANVDDVISLFGEVSAAPSAGGVLVSAGGITALLLKGTNDTVAPTILTTTNIPAAGTTVRIVHSEQITWGVDDNTDYTLTSDGGAVTLTFYGFDTTTFGNDTLVFTTSRTILSTETLTIGYTQPGDGVKDIAGNLLATVASVAVTNASTQGGGASTWYYSTATTDSSISNYSAQIDGAPVTAGATGTITQVRVACAVVNSAVGLKVGIYDNTTGVLLGSGSVGSMTTGTDVDVVVTVTPASAGSLDVTNGTVVKVAFVAQNDGAIAAKYLAAQASGTGFVSYDTNYAGFPTTPLATSPVTSQYRVGIYI